jgi:pimeloyl-ACP methyl ester carboxylesterase
VLRAYASGRLFGESYGQGPLSVLALHGWRRSHGDFADMLGEPFETRTGHVGALALDLPGHGASPEPVSVWGSREYAAALEEVLEVLELPAVVVGHSFGGRVAVHLAARRPDAVAGLVLTGVPLVRLGPPSRPALQYRLVRSLARARLVSSARLEAARERYGSEDYRAARGVMRAILVKVLAESYEDELRSLSCPVELVVGANDDVTPPAIAEVAAGLLASARVEVVPGAGHMTPLEVPGALRAAVARLLR